MTMTKQERESFIAMANVFNNGSGVLVESINQEPKRAKEADLILNRVLSAAFEGAQTSEVRDDYAVLRDLQRAIAKEIEALTSATVGILSHQRFAWQMPDFTGRGIPTEPIKKALDYLELCLAELRFFRGSALYSLNQRVFSYITLCEAYLGYDIGDHKYINRAFEAMKVIFMAVASWMFPPVGAGQAAADVIVAIMTSPDRVAVKDQIRVAQGRDREVRFRKALQLMRTSTEFDERVIKSSVVGAVEGIVAFENGLRKLGFLSP
jgi:hypothetical protein